jgi:bifunctional UDP-N-acetylglucosamine pyrophosphorylase/glucosamine-1-phosphate N-acetyltransferase
MRAVVLAAGGGVRLQPLTLTKPKCLLPIGGRALLEWVFKALKEAGIKEVLTILSPEGRKVKEVYGSGSRLGLKVSYAWDRHPKGTGASLTLAKSFTKDRAFLTVYGDLYLSAGTIKGFLKEGLKRLKKGSPAVLAVVKVEKPQEYGVVQVKDKDRVLKLLEKPERPRSNLANAGIYLFTPEIFRAIRYVKPSPRGEIELTEAINLLTVKGEVRTVKLPTEDWLDVGRPWDLLEANRRALLGAEGEVEGVVEPQVILRGKITIEKGVVIRFGSVIDGPAFIGSGSEVGPFARIRPYTSLGRNVRIGSFCEIKNSIVMDGSKIPHLCYVGDSIIGENCNFGAGTLIANLRLDEQPVKVEVKGLKVSSGLRKFGVILGDEVKTAVNVSIMPGVKVGPRSLLGPNLSISTDIPADTLVTGRQKLFFKRLKGRAEAC